MTYLIKNYSNYYLNILGDIVDYILICLQTNYIKPGYHKINIQMNLEDLKKLRGFEITNSN